MITRSISESVSVYIYSYFHVHLLLLIASSSTLKLYSSLRIKEKFQSNFALEKHYATSLNRFCGFEFESEQRTERLVIQGNSLTSAKPTAINS